MGDDGSPDPPVQMTSSSQAVVWRAKYGPFGDLVEKSGSASLDARFPGQWFQLESGLAWNWHRHYDASIGRYVQPDPLGLVDGPSVYGYVRRTRWGRSIQKVIKPLSMGRLRLPLQTSPADHGVGRQIQATAEVDNMLALITTLLAGTLRDIGIATTALAIASAMTGEATQLLQNRHIIPRKIPRYCRLGLGSSGGKLP